MRARVEQRSVLGWNKSKQILLDAIGDMYIITMKHQVTGYANVTTQKIIIHLYDKYGNITAEVLEENEHKTKTDYNPNQPIKVLYIQLNQAINFTDAASTPFIQSQIIATAYNMVFTTGLYNNTCREWRRCLPADKTWAKFQLIIPLQRKTCKNCRRLHNSRGTTGPMQLVKVQVRRKAGYFSKIRPLPWLILTWLA